MEFFNTKSVEPATPVWIPTTKVISSFEQRDIKYKHLQQKMKDNGWKLYQEETTDNEDDFVEYFMHPTYGDVRADVYNYYTADYSVLKFPLIAHFDDLKGLGCSFDLSKGFGELMSNEWCSCWDTRKGRRRLKYYTYLKRREETKRQWELEAKKTKTQAQLNSRI